jgi:chemotaxis protein methyltransferase CheR
MALAAESLIEAQSYPTEVERLEVDLLLEAIYRHYDFDFRSYAYASITRRIWKRTRAEGLSTISALQERVLHDRQVMERLLLDLSVTVSAMFRDPSFFRALRDQVVPLLRSYPFIRIWHAGCSTGEEVYSMAILLQEENLYDRCRLYATDINQAVLQRARTGMVPLARMKEYTANYLQAGGKRAFSEYYTAHHDGALFSPALLSNVVFAQHNLVTDRSFNEFNIILCRNVMIYFGHDLQEHVHELFHASLPKLGILALGHKESLQMSRFEQCYEALDPREKIYRRIA